MGNIPIKHNMSITGRYITMRGGNIIGTPPVIVPPSLLLDLYPNAAAAYSLRKLRSDYIGACVRVRRSSDNAEQDIGFDLDGDLDTAALLAFVGSGNGFVTVWYDQSGNNRNAFQTTLTRQSRIVNSGLIEILGTRPCVNTYENDTFRDYQIAYSNLRPLPISMISVHKVDLLPTQGGFNQITFHIGGTRPSGGGGRYEFYTDNTNIHASQRRGGGLITQSLNAFSYVVQAAYFKTTNLQQRLNGIDSAVANYSGTPFSTASNWNILNASNQQTNFHGAKRFQEIIIFESDLFSHRVAIESNINQHYGVY
jgi:hypothetical protein